MKDKLLGLLKQVLTRFEQVKAFDFDETLTRIHTFKDRNLDPVSNIKTGIPFSKDSQDLLAVVTDHDDPHFVLDYLLILLNRPKNTAYQCISMPIAEHYQVTVYLLGEELYPVIILSNPETHRDAFRKNSRLEALLSLLMETELIDQTTPVRYYEDDIRNLMACDLSIILKNRPNFKRYLVSNHPENGNFNSTLYAPTNYSVTWFSTSPPPSPPPSPKETRKPLPDGLVFSIEEDDEGWLNKP